jgi:hypothetical protein
MSTARIHSASARVFRGRARSLLSFVLAPAIAAITGCSGTGQPAVDYPAFAVVSVPGAIAAGDFTVSLDEALVAFGPAYFCASATGSPTLCDAALAEITETTAIDALNPELQPLGQVHGFTGRIQSTSYDYGVHWFLTENQPTPAPSAPFGHSARFRGTAERGDVSVSFVADIDVRPQFPGQRAVTTARAIADITEESSVRLEVHLDVAPWIAAIDWQEAAAAGAGSTYEIEIGSPEHNAVVTAMQSSHQLSFVWAPAAQ